MRPYTLVNISGTLWLYILAYNVNCVLVSKLKRLIVEMYKYLYYLYRLQYDMNWQKGKAFKKLSR